MDEETGLERTVDGSAEGLLRMFSDLAGALARRDFFSLLARRIAQVSGFPRALIVEVHDDLGWGRAFASRDEEFEAVKLPLQGLWAALLDAPVPTCYPDVATTFPKDPLLLHHSISGAVGMAISGGSEGPVGFVALLGTGQEDAAIAVQALPSAVALAGAALEWEQDQVTGGRLLRELEIKRNEVAFIHTLTEALRTRASLEELCGSVARLIPLGWRHPEAARARLVLDGAEYASQPFEDTPWSLSSSMVANGVVRGRIEVFYANEWWQEDELPFEVEEHYLLDSIARTLGEAIERREAEAALRKESAVLAQERNRLETILHSIGEGVVVTDNANRIVLMNRAAQDLLGDAAPDPVGRDFLSMLEDEEFLETWRTTAEQGRDFSKQELKVHLPELRALWVTRSSVPDLSEGRPGFVTILHDVTKEREIDRMKTDFVSAVSHELRTPLTSIKGFAVTLKGKAGIEPDLRKRFLGIIDEEADRLAALIEELLIMARIESGRMVVGQEPVDIGEVIRHVLAAFLPEAEKRGIILLESIPENLAKPMGDREKIRIIVANLVENAVKFTPTGGTVQVRAAHDQNEVRVEVLDTGIGIPESEQQRIFERFYRVHRPGRAEAGTGLGLFLVREMAVLHGGHVEVSSNVGEGSRFSVYLPLKGRRGPGMDQGGAMPRGVERV